MITTVKIHVEQFSRRENSKASELGQRNTKCSLVTLTMHRGFLIAAIALVTTTALVPAQAPQTDEKRQQLEALGKTVRAQQAEIAANQAKIDEKLATLAEVVRTAWIFASRGGR